MSDGSPANPVQIAERLGLFLGSHQTISRRVEPEFMGLGNSLQGLYAETTALTAKIRAAVDLLGHQETGALPALRRLAEGSLEEFRSRRQAIAANLEAVKAISDLTSSLIHQTSTLSQIGLFLRVVGFNFNVEYAHIGKTTGMFALMAQEVIKLSDNISRVASEIDDDCRSIQASQRGVRERTARGLQALAALAREAEEAVTEAVDRIEQIMGRALAALEEATGHAATIADQVGELVMKVQLHDSMNQRIEHVVQALTTVVTTLREATARTADDEQDKKILAGAWRIVSLQGGHIRHIIDEVDEAGRHSRAAFQSIDQDVAAMGQSFAALKLGMTDSQTSSLSHLQGALTRLSRLMAQGSTMVDELHAGAGQVSSMVDRLNRHMLAIDDICFDIHLKALNAIIRAASLGDQGRTLNTLAQKTKSLADGARDFVDLVTGIHQGIGQAACRLRSEAIGEAGRGYDSRLEQAVTDITAGLDRFAQDSEACTREAEALQTTIRLASDGLEFLPRLADELSAQHEQLAAIAEAMAPWGQGFGDGELNEDAICLLQLYTTDQERELHAAFLGLPTAEATPPTAAGPTDDVVLFDSEPSTEAKKEDEALGDNVELF